MQKLLMVGVCFLGTLASPASSQEWPTRTLTTSAPVRLASQRAAIRVPLPDISARDPSGFQIAISSQSSPDRNTSSMPSASRDSSRTRSGVSGSVATR